MPHITAGAMVATIVMLAHLQFAQSKMTPTVPGTPGDPVWQGIVRLGDGRAFVTDGGFAIEAAIARPATLPERELPGKVLQDYFNAAHKDECRLSELTAAATGKTYSTPTGIAVNATYVNYLRRVLPAGAVRLRTTSPNQPVIIIAGGKAVGVLMPVKQ
jgi:hypothetical protein